MSRVCRTSKEIAGAIKDNEDIIIVEGDLKNGLLRIKAVGTAAWGVCAVFLAAAIACYLAAPTAAVTTTPAGGGAAFAAGLTASAATAATLSSAVAPAVAIGVFAGGVGALNTLRDHYEIAEINDKSLTLKRKRHAAGLFR